MAIRLVNTSGWSDAKFSAWKMQQKAISSSLSPALVPGSSEYVTPLKAYMVIQHGHQDPQNNAMWAGKRLEPMVRSMLAESTGLKVAKNNFTFQHSDIPYIHDTPDGWVYDKDGRQTQELKTTSLKGGGKYSDDVDDAAWIQCQWHNFVQGTQRCYLGAFLMMSKEFKWFIVERDNALINDLAHAAELFWIRHIEAQVMPEPMPGDLDLVNQVIYPWEAREGQPATLDLGEDYAHLLEQWSALKDDVSALESEARMKRKAMDGMKAKISMAIGPNRIAIAGDYVIGIDEKFRKGYEVKPSSRIEITFKKR